MAEFTLNTPPSLSIVVPCFNEDSCIGLFYRTVNQVLEDYSAIQPLEVEFVFIDDGSTDKTLAMLRDLSKEDDHVRYYSFSRNFGKEAALLAGMDHASGDLVAIMDADMQDPPSLLPELVTAVLTQQCDIARARRTNRTGEPPIRSWFSRKFYRIINRCSRATIVDGARDYMVLSRTVANELKSMREYNRFFKGLSSWVGFKTEWFEYQNVQRAAGETKWNFFSLAAYALDAIISFSTAPLTAVSIGGGACAILATFLMIMIVIRALFFGDPVAGWPSTISVILFIGGIQLICLGILGQYLAKTYLETKNRPVYIIKDSSETP